MSFECYPAPKEYMGLFDFHINIEDSNSRYIKEALTTIKSMVRSLTNDMGTAIELLTTANATLDEIDAKTTAEGEEVKALADAYEALKNEIGKDNPEVVSALEGLNARLMATGDRVTNIYNKPAEEEVPEEPPTEPLPTPEEEAAEAENPKG